MKTLILLRHANTENGFDKKDIDRCLTEKGKNDALLMATKLNNLKIIPQIIVSSNALRTQQTALLFSKQLTNETTIILNSTLYNANSNAIQHEINALPNGFETILIVCHNPGISDFANSINGPITFGLPPCGMIIYKFETKDWSNIFNAANELVSILLPN